MRIGTLSCLKTHLENVFKALTDAGQEQRKSWRDGLAVKITLAAPEEDLGSVPYIHTVAHNHVQLQFQAGNLIHNV